MGIFIPFVMIHGRPRALIRLYFKSIFNSVNQNYVIRGKNGYDFERFLDGDINPKILCVNKLGFES